jgi:hypothetical protein
MCGTTGEDGNPVGSEEWNKGSVDETKYGVLCSGCYMDTLNVELTGKTFDDRVVEMYSQAEEVEEVEEKIS